MTRRIGFAAAGNAVLLLLVFATGASAAGEIPFCHPGSGAGQCNGPRGIAVDTETGKVYVADSGNNRIDVFEADGEFAMAFGWGVDSGAAELQTCTTASTCNAGIAGAGAGQFSAPTWVAVDNEAASSSRHDIYVGSDNFHVQKFKPTGEFLKAFGEEGKGGACQFARTADSIAVGPGGEVDVADSYEDAPEHFVSRIDRFDAAGSCLGEVKLFEGHVELIRDLAVDAGGDFYVSVAGFPGGVTRKYSPTGGLLYTLEGIETVGLAVDGAGNVYGKQRGLRLAKLENTFYIAKFGPSSPVVQKQFGYVIATTFDLVGLAAQETGLGDVYASEGSLGIDYPKVPVGPVVLPEPCEVQSGGLGSAHATLQAEVNPEGKATSFHFEYITETDFSANGNSFSGAHPASSTAESGSIGEDAEAHLADAKIEGLAPETEYRCRVVAKDSEAHETVGQQGSFKTREGFEFGAVWSEAVAQETATVKAEGDPLGTPAKGQIEYVEDAKYQLNGFAEALRAPAGEEVDYGAGETMQLRGFSLAGLTPGTLYHYRLRINNGTPPEGLVCPEQKAPPCAAFEHSFRTRLPEADEADGRAWELVSPGEKNSAEVAVPGIAGGIFEDSSIRIQAAAGSGEALTYTSFTSFGAAEAAPATSQYLSKRTEAGWGTENISPAGRETSVGFPPYTGFSADLGFGALAVEEVGLTPDCPPNTPNLYLRDNASGALHCLTPEVPQSSSTLACTFVYSGASEDGARAFFASGAAYVGSPAGPQGFTLYEWSAAGGLRVVSVLPGEGEPAEPTEGTSFGARGGPSSGSNCQTGQTILRYAISGDGSRAFWTYSPRPSEKEKEPPTRLFVRVNHSETLQLDAVQSGGGKAGEGVFQAAGADGSVAYFTDTSRLIAGAKAEVGSPDLYRYELGNVNPLSDVTKGLVSAGVQGVLGASDDGSYIYFVAKAVLSGEEENPSGEKAEAGKANLYVSHEGKNSFIATLAPQDQNDWEHEPKTLTARVSPDGRHLAFLSVEAEKLAGYDNTIASGEHCEYEPVEKILKGSPLCPQAFVYDAGAKTLSCASCNPAGSRPLGQTFLPGWTNVYEGPRYLSDDGSRLFFESYDALLGGDENGRRDVYEFERPGAGSCSAENPNFDPASGGCHFLVSSGKSSDETFLVDASADGRDVFFSTRSALTGWDGNQNYDVYDYREGGGFPEPPAGTPCAGEECKTPATPAPSLLTPASSTFNGLGNLPPSKPPVKPPLTSAQKLAKAMKACKSKHNRHKRTACERQARKRYPPPHKSKAKSHKGRK